MNENRKSEGELIDSIFTDDRSKAQKLLDKCKKIESGKQMAIVSFGKGTLYLVPAETDIEIWKRKKSQQLDKMRKYKSS
jgi:hypothetical protein